MREKRSQNVNDNEGPKENTNQGRAMLRGLSWHLQIIPLILPDSKHERRRMNG
jgi:hypothetical protein